MREAADVLLGIGLIMVIALLIELRWAVHQAAQHAVHAANLVAELREQHEQR